MTEQSNLGSGQMYVSHKQQEKLHRFNWDQSLFDPEIGAFCEEMARSLEMISK
jgi:hypothetical protein